MHHGGQKEIDRLAGFGAVEAAIGHADDLVKARAGEVVGNAEGLTDGVRILGKAPRPVFVRQDGNGMAAGTQVVLLREQAAGGGVQSEIVEHIARNVLYVRSFHLSVGAQGDFHALGFGEGDQGGAAGRGLAHALE